MKKLIKISTCILSVLVAVFFMIYVGLYFLFYKRSECNLLASKEDILIFAPHPDDGVIMAGGYAIQTKRNGGKVKVGFLTGDDIRIEEAHQAWRIIGLTEEDLIPLRFDNNINLTLENLPTKINLIKNLINEINPKIIFIPLYEGGHHDHDITNYMVSTAVESLNKNIRLYECPEYNYYFSIKNTPEKFLDIISNLIPFFEYRAPPSFIDLKNTSYLCMTKAEIEIKKKMLSKFITQHPKTLIMHFGFNDRFKIFKNHDYYSPPHDYGNWLVYKARYSDYRLFRKIFSKPYWKNKTVYSYNDRRDLSSLLKN